MLAAAVSELTDNVEAVNNLTAGILDESVTVTLLQIITAA
jgi:hypothetical protein